MRDMGTTDVLMDVFGPWLPWLFGVGAILVVGGLLAKEMAPNSSAQKLGHSANNRYLPPQLMRSKRVAKVAKSARDCGPRDPITGASPRWN